MPMPNRQTTDGNYRYNFQGQEKDPETGMEAFELRLWDGRLGRWLTIDPYNEFHSPYLGMGNNPVSTIDPDGGHTDSTRVKKNEDGTYTVVAVNPTDGDNGIYIDDNGKNGEKIGYSATPYSFFNTDINEEMKCVINPNDNSGRNFLNNLFSTNPNEAYYALNATGGKKYDFKRTNGGNKVLYSDANVLDYFRGMPILEKQNDLPIFASARDVGNIGAGLVTGRNGTSWEFARRAFNALESKQKGHYAVETLGTQYAERLGWNIGNALYLRYTLSRRPGNTHLYSTERPRGYLKLHFKQVY